MNGVNERRRKADDKVPAEIARAVVMNMLDYDPETGVFTRKVTRPGLRGRKGSIAGTKTRLGYVRIRVLGRQVMAHRLAMLVMTGEWPSDEVDHIDGDPSNNRLANLRLATAEQNARNARIRKDNTIGLKGVKKNGSKYAAWVRVNKRPVYLGTFETPEEAHFTYAATARALYGEFARVA